MAAGAPDAVVVDLASVDVPLMSRELFGREAPLEVEIGSGKGQFLLAMAARAGDRCLLGVERAEKYLILAAARASRSGLANVKFVRTTAEDLLFRCLAPGTVAAIHVYFPDPWPKKRHHKRRFFNPTNVQRAAEVLISGGLLRVKTDHALYGGEIEGLLRACPLLTPVSSDDAFAGLPESTYEVKYGREGRPLLRLAFRRRS